MEKNISRDEMFFPFPGAHNFKDIMLINLLITNVNQDRSSIDRIKQKSRTENFIC